MFPWWEAGVLTIERFQFLREFSVSQTMERSKYCRLMCRKCLRKSKSCIKKGVITQTFRKFATAWLRFFSLQREYTLSWNRWKVIISLPMFYKTLSTKPVRNPSSEITVIFAWCNVTGSFIVFLRGCEAIRVRNWDEFVCLFVCFFFSSW